MTGHEDDILGHLERAIADDDPDLNGQAPEPQPAPQDAQPAPQQPPPNAMDFAQEQPQTPVDAGAPEEPQQAPQGPAPQPAVPPQNAQGIANNYLQGQAQTQQAEDRAYDLKADALKQTAGIEQARNDDRTGALGETVDANRQFQKARDVIDQIHMRDTQMADAEFDKNINEERDLAAKDPHDFWGNSSVSNKIGALVALVGAGVAKHDASQAFQQIINNRVAETQRKQHIYQQIGHDLRFKDYRNENRYRTQLSTVEAKRVAAIDDIQNRLKLQLSKTANPQVAANYQSQIADLEAQKAKAYGTANKDVTSTLLSAHQATLQEEAGRRTAAYQQGLLDIAGYKATHPTAPNQDAKNYLPVVGISNYGVARDSHKEFVKDATTTANVLNSLEEVLRIGDDPKLSLDEKQQQFAVNKALASGEVRAKLGVGANVTGEEGAYMNALLPSLVAFETGKLGYGDFKKRIRETEKLVTQSHLNKFNATRHPDSEITPQYLLYPHIQRVAQEEQAVQQEAQAIQAVEQKDAGNPQKTILDLEAIGTPSAKQRAQEILAMMRK